VHSHACVQVSEQACVHGHMYVGGHGGGYF
jgi:hypothetical protein